MTDLSQLINRMGQATGRGVRIAIVDTGIEADHPWIGGRLTASYFVEDSPGGSPIVHAVPAKDVCGHGTAAAGQARRLAPDAELISVRVLGDDRAGSSEALVAALAWLTTQDVHVVNLSLSTMRLGLAFRILQAVDALHARNIPCVCAQGYHRSGQDYPTSFASTLGVTYDEMPAASICFRPGSLVEFAAGGVDIEAAWLGKSTRRVTGSSYAAPLVSGLCARLLELNPDLTPYELKTLLKAYADRLTAGWAEGWMAAADRPPGP